MFDERGQLLERRPQAGIMVGLADAVWDVVRGDRHRCAIRCRVKRPSHRHLIREGRVARLECDRLLDSSARQKLEKSAVCDICPIGRFS